MKFLKTDARRAAADEYHPAELIPMTQFDYFRLLSWRRFAAATLEFNVSVAGRRVGG